ncbi:TetR/AcrR family transcriptional regulator C-terminal domain-containing protein [Sinanaerobacter chloroacetimidivorans]|jgi:probable dihydroxyacetone kinase regulator|uniref:TetR/AcrR family transcriptional regulator C-terminal domain-containing protein n=1 Tax=Sinanaerobacter chloroacetimidivorans TaxID=2818044 RepID=A0A8J8B347_9FIRM|nr:TetR/AcrR family transcriptional regulator C-terminal domain-containing protein [Sinanaerobacter chloroacetimidivorans]MBR0599377.1 TetR/AcrR family transcriptional regulator C-terminal domain-containing protein [Sinanaerobacter chloroacetimidivorans]
MYSGKTDLTKKAMAQSLKKFLSVKPLNKISIREIVEDSGLNRQTFYYHFQDIYELLEWMIDHEVVSTIKESENFLSWQDAGIYLLRYIQSNEALSLCIFHSVGRDSLKKFFYKDAFGICMRFLKENTKGIEYDEEDFQYLAHFYSISFASLLEDWVTNGMKRSPEEVIHILDLIVSGSARQALERFAEERKARETP